MSEPDVLVLRTFIAARENDHDHGAPVGVVYPITGATMDSQFINPFAYAFMVTRVPFGQSVKPGSDSHLGLFIAKPE